MLAVLGVPAGSVTLLQFSSQSCAPCRTTSRLLAEIATDTPAVSHVEVSVEEHLDAVRELDIRRTPTMLIVDSSRRIARRASGLPTSADLRTALLGVS